MDFITAVKTCLQKYATFAGRASRPEFWWFALFTIGVAVVGGAIFRHWVNQIISLALFVPSIAVGARRLHDIGKSGWFQLLWFIPFIGWGLLIYWAVQPSAGANEHGAPAEVPPPQLPTQA
jgi:uncharacterized membrane protein YhaH (DUF805 family)